MRILLHYEDHGTENRYITEEAEITLNADPSVAVVKSFVPPDSPNPTNFKGEVLKRQIFEDEEWVTIDRWYILPDIKRWKLYNEYGAHIANNISSVDVVIKKIVRTWKQRDGSYFNGEPTTFRPDKVFVEPAI